MKTDTVPHGVNSNGGFALLATLLVLTLLTTVSAIVFGTAMASFRAGVTDVEKSRTYYAAEGAADYAMAGIALALIDGSLTEDELTALTAPDIEGFSFDSFSVAKNGEATIERITEGVFAGLSSLTQVVDITAQASAPDHTASEILVTAKAQSIPIFQFGVFFEKDLEVHPGGVMEFGGWVHSNGNIYLNSNDQYFKSLITTPNNVYHDRKDKHEVFPGVRIADGTGTDVVLDFDSRDTPDFNAFRGKSDDRFDNRLMTNAYDVDSLKIPLPDGVEPAEILKPRDDLDSGLERDTKMAWKADWYIEVDLSQITPNANSLCQNAMAYTRSGTLGVPSRAECKNIFTFTPDGWWDARERVFVDVLDIDVGQLQSWGTGSNAVSVLYVTMDTVGGPDARSDGVHPVVRIANGATLTAPITFATDHPFYVRGDYNSVGWRPSALMGDAINVLSNSWSDAGHQTVYPDKASLNAAPLAAASNTTAYAAILAGHVATPCDHEAPGCGARVTYGGGLENFFRWQETWSGDRFIFRGSLVSLAFSEQAVGRWSWATYYVAPYRDFAFDTRFNDIANMPPGTPHVGNVVHTAFRPIF